MVNGLAFVLATCLIGAGAGIMASAVFQLSIFQSGLLIASLVLIGVVVSTIILRRTTR
jgi:hypothetical protein